MPRRGPAPGHPPGFGWILGGGLVYTRDTAQVVVAALQAWFYLTPIVYTVDSARAALQSRLWSHPLPGSVLDFGAFPLRRGALQGPPRRTEAGLDGAPGGGAPIAEREWVESVDLA